MEDHNQEMCVNLTFFIYTVYIRGCYHFVQALTNMCIKFDDDSITHNDIILFYRALNSVMNLSSFFGVIFIVLSLLNLCPLRFCVLLHVIRGQFYCQIHIFSILLCNPSENSCYPVFSEQTIETHILPSSKPPILNKQFGNISISFAIKTCISTRSHPSRVLKVPNKSI